MKGDDLVKLYESLYNDDMIWFWFGSLISADTYLQSSKEEILGQYTSSIQTLKDMSQYIPMTNIPIEDKEDILGKVESCLELLETEYNKISKDSNS